MTSLDYAARFVRGTRLRDVDDEAAEELWKREEGEDGAMRDR